MNIEPNINIEKVFGKYYVLALDFDETIYFNETGKVNKAVVDQAINFKNNGWKIVLWTCRSGDLSFCINLCKENGLEFDAVNGNIPEVVKDIFNVDKLPITAYNNGFTPKVFASMYVDDKAFGSIETFLKLNFASGK